MKKKWALLLAAVMALQPLSALTVNAEATVTGVYADVYGIEVDFSEEPTAAELENLTLLKGESEEVTVEWTDGEAGTKRTINVALDTDTKYTLSFGTTEKTFQVKTLFAENFDDTATFADADVSDAEPSTFSNVYGEFEVNYGTYGAFIKNGRVWVTDGAFSITALDTNLDYDNATFTADIQGYGKNYMGGRGGTTLTAPNTGVVNLYMLSRAGVANNDAVGAQLQDAKFFLGKTSGTGVYTTENTTGYTYTGAENFAFGAFKGKNSTPESYTEITVDKDVAVESASSEKTIGVRANGEMVKAFIGDEIGAEAVTDTEAGAFSILADKTGVASIDNVIITTYTENVAPAISGTLSVEDITYDYDGIVLSFNESVEEVGPISRDKIEVYCDGTQVAITTSVDTEDSTKLIIVPDGYAADHAYEVVVPAGFGTPTLTTDAEWRESFDLESTSITVTDEEFTLEGILFTFDTDLTDITDQADLDSIALEIDGVAVATADRTITKDATTLLVMPNNAADYAVGKTYKVTIPEGFGTPNVYLHSEYVFNEEFTKIPLEVVEFTGNKGFVQVEFDIPLQSTTDVSGVEIRDANDAVVTATPSITADGMLKVDIPSMVRDEVYEIYIPENFGTEAIGTSKKILKKFSQKTIAYENFENNGESFGFESAIGTIGTFKDPLDANNTMAVISGTQTIGVPQIELLDNYTFEFDQRIFYPIGIDRTMNKTLNESGGAHEASYNTATTTFNSLRFNYIDANNYFNMNFRETGGGYTEKSGSDTSTGSVSAALWNKLDQVSHGDMYRSPEGFIAYNYGDVFPADFKHFKSDGTRVLASERVPQPSSKYEVIKSGKNIKINKNASQILNVNFRFLTNTKGKIQFNSQGYSYEVWDNVRVSTFTLIDEPQVVALNLTTDIVLGADGKSTQTAINGTFTLKNYTDEVKPTRAVVVAYGEDSEMLCANMISTTELQAGETQRAIAFDLDNTAGTKTIKLFLWDDLAHKTKIENYDFPTS